VQSIHSAAGTGTSDTKNGALQQDSTADQTYRAHQVLGPGISVPASSTCPVPGQTILQAGAVSGSPGKHHGILPVYLESPPPTTALQGSAPKAAPGSPAHAAPPATQPQQQTQPQMKQLRPVAAKARGPSQPSCLLAAPESPFARQQQPLQLQLHPLPSPRGSATYVTAPFLAASSSSEEEQEPCHRKEAQAARPRSGDIISATGKLGGSTQQGAGLNATSAWDVTGASTGVSVAHQRHGQHTRARSGSEESVTGDEAGPSAGALASSPITGSGSRRQALLGQGGGARGPGTGPLLGMAGGLGGSPVKGGAGAGGHSSAAESEVEAALMVSVWRSEGRGGCHLHMMPFLGGCWEGTLMFGWRKMYCLGQ
jgi:hypothetical protein